MTQQRGIIRQGTRGGQRGFTMIEMVFAIAVFFIGISGLMTLAALAIAKTSGHGEQGTKTTEYAQDKMEQALALSYTSLNTDVTTDLSQSTTSVPVNTPGTGLTANPSCVFANPSTCYVDYISSLGVVSTSSAGSMYRCEWMIVDDPLLLSKTVTVYVIALNGADYSTAGAFLAPSTTLVAIRTKN